MAKRKLRVVYQHPDPCLDCGTLGRALFDAAAFTMAAAFDGSLLAKLREVEEELAKQNSMVEDLESDLTEKNNELEEVTGKCPPALTEAARELIRDFDRGYDDSAALEMERIRALLRNIDGHTCPIPPGVFG